MSKRYSFGISQLLQPTGTGGEKDTRCGHRVSSRMSPISTKAGEATTSCYETSLSRDLRLR